MTSPGRTSPWKSSIAHRTDHGMGSTWPGWSSDCATIWPCGSKRAHEKSSMSQITGEYEARMTVARISRTIAIRPSTTTSSVMGSTTAVHRLLLERTISPCSPTSPAQRGGTTVVDPISSTMAGPAKRPPGGSRSRT